MKPLTLILKKLSLPMLIIGMIILIVGVFFIQGGSVVQKWLFLIGATSLGSAAAINKEKMYTSCEIIAVIGAIMAFTTLPQLFKYSVILSLAVIAIIYLKKKNYKTVNKYWIIGALSLIFLAAGLATNIATVPILWGFFLGVGALLLIVYSIIDIKIYKAGSIAWIFLILNIFFAIKPMTMFITEIMKLL